MVLYFKERAKQPKRLAINTDKRIYVTGDAAKPEHEQDAIVISSRHLDNVWAEMQFCGYDWAENLGVVMETWSCLIPTF